MIQIFQSNLKELMIDLWSEIKFFQPDEFDDPTEKGSGKKMNINFIQTLDLIRSDCGFSFHINSGIRSSAHNAAMGGKSDSAHLSGVAVDILCLGSPQRFSIIEAAIKRGIKRIGIGSTFIHLDGNLSLPQRVAWLYPSNNAG